MSANPSGRAGIPSRPARTARRWLVTATAASAVILSLVTGGTSGAFTATVTNSTDTATSAPFFTCTGADTAPGPASTTFLYRLLETQGFTAADSSGNNLPGTYTKTGVTYSQPGPCPRDTARAIVLNGSTGYVGGPATAQTAPTTFTIETWFQTTTTSGGRLIGYGNVNSTTGHRTSSSDDRHVYMSNSGQIYFGIDPTAKHTVGSTAAYNDGAWHHVAATFSPSTGMALYVDGQQVAGDATVTTAPTYSGNWRIGFDDLTGWTNAPTSNFFGGGLAYAAAYTTVLTPTQVQDHYIAGH